MKSELYTVCREQKTPGATIQNAIGIIILYHTTEDS